MKIDTENDNLIEVLKQHQRWLENEPDENGVVHAGSGDTSIFIYPGYRFRVMGKAKTVDQHLYGV